MKGTRTKQRRKEKQPKTRNQTNQPNKNIDSTLFHYTEFFQFGAFYDSPTRHR